MMWIKLNCPLIGCQSYMGALLLIQHIPQVIPRECIVRIELYRPFKGGQGFLELAKSDEQITVIVVENSLFWRETNSLFIGAHRLVIKLELIECVPLAIIGR